MHSENFKICEYGDEMLSMLTQLILIIEALHSEVRKTGVANFISLCSDSTCDFQI
jgi:hypothetical protein